MVFTASGTTYALNGPAIDDGSYSDVHAIWADDPNLGNGLKKGMGPFIQEGLDLC